MSKFKSLKVSLGIGLALIALQALSVVPAVAQVDIYVLGRPGSTFSPHSARNLEEMKDLFDRFEADIREVLEIGGWGGDADDLFLAMRSAKEGDGTFTKTTINPGDTLKWMANRKGGGPSVGRNPRWAGIPSNGKARRYRRHRIHPDLRGQRAHGLSPGDARSGDGYRGRSGHRQHQACGDPQHH